MEDIRIRLIVSESLKHIYDWSETTIQKKKDWYETPNVYDFSQIYKMHLLFIILLIEIIITT